MNTGHLLGSGYGDDCQTIPNSPGGRPVPWINVSRPLALVEAFRPCFRQQVFATARHVLVGWILGPGPRPLAEVWRATGRAGTDHGDTAYSFLASARWDWDDLGKILALVVDARADLDAARVRLAAVGSSFDIRSPGRQFVVRTPWWHAHADRASDLLRRLRGKSGRALLHAVRQRLARRLCVGDTPVR